MSGKKIKFIEGNVSVEKLLLFIFGIIFVAVILVFAVLIPNPSQFSFNVFIVVLALAAAGIGALLPGMMEIEGAMLVKLRAGGALALFALVLIFRPTIEHKTIRYEEPRELAEPIALDYLKEVDTGNITKAWSLVDPEAQGLSFPSLNDLTNVYQNFRKPFGDVEYRKLSGSSGAQSLTGAPIGLYRVLTYKTKFVQSGMCRVEEVTLRATSSLQWKVFSHLINPSTIEC